MAVREFKKVSQATIEVAPEVFFRANPALGYRTPRLVWDRVKDGHRATAFCAVVDWWQEVSQRRKSLADAEAQFEELMNWASVALIDDATDFNLPPHWDNRPTWGSLRTHAKDGGGLTVRLLEEVAWSLLRGAYHGRLTPSHFIGCEGFGLGWHWAQLAHAAHLVLEGIMDVAEFQRRFMDAPPTVDKEVVLDWLREKDVSELERLVEALNRRLGWCPNGIVEALENNLEGIDPHTIGVALDVLRREGFDAPAGRVQG